MSVSVHVEFRGDRQIGRELQRLKTKVGDVSDVLDELGGVLETSTQERFIKQQGPDGSPWKGHEKSTELKRGAGADILRDRQHLYDSITSRASRDSVAVGTNLIYARIHQLGGETGRAGHRFEMPARPYLGIDDDDRAEILATIRDHLAEGAR